MGTQTVPMPADTTIIGLNVSPVLGGLGRNGFANIMTPAAGVMLIGNNLPGDVAPPSNDPNWFTVLTMATTSNPRQEITLPRWIARGAAGGSASITIEGVQ